MIAAYIIAKENKKTISLLVKIIVNILFLNGKMTKMNANNNSKDSIAANSIGKLVAGGMMQDIAKFAVDLQGLGGLVTDPAIARSQAQIQAMLMRSPAVRIEGGTDQILRNIIAERVLGLPEDMRADKGIAFSQIPTGG